MYEVMVFLVLLLSYRVSPQTCVSLFQYLISVLSVHGYSLHQYPITPSKTGCIRCWNFYLLIYLSLLPAIMLRYPIFIILLNSNICLADQSKFNGSEKKEKTISFSSLKRCKILLYLKFIIAPLFVPTRQVTVMSKNQDFSLNILI